LTHAAGHHPLDSADDGDCRLAERGIQIETHRLLGLPRTFDIQRNPKNEPKRFARTRLEIHSSLAVAAYGSAVYKESRAHSRMTK
jgi:hypothetical protein